MAESANDLLERLSRLESQQAGLQSSNRRLRLIAGALLVFCTALLTMGQSSSGISDTLQAQQFLLRDSAGKLRGAIGVTRDGAVGFNLDDSDGRTRLTVDINADGTPGIDLFDQAGRLRATMALGKAGEPGLGLYGPDGRLRTALDIPKSQTPGLAFYHENGKPAWGAP